MKSKIKKIIYRNHIIVFKLSETEINNGKFNLDVTIIDCEYNKRSTIADSSEFALTLERMRIEAQAFISNTYFNGKKMGIVESMAAEYGFLDV